MDEENEIYYNDFFEGYPKLSKRDLEIWLEEHDRKKTTFAGCRTLNNLSKRDIILTRQDPWVERAKFYFLPFLVNCYKFTRQHKLPYFTLMCSPTFIFYRDRLHLRNWMDTIHRAFFKCLDMCLKPGEKIMLLIEKRFHIKNPIDGGTQQLYNMLWDYDLTPNPKNVKIATEKIETFNPDFPVSGELDLCRRTLWFEDDLEFLMKRYINLGQREYPEIIDLSKYPEKKQEIYEKTARQFVFQLFEPLDWEDDCDDCDDCDDEDNPDDWDFDPDDTELNDLDPTLDFDQEDEEMNKIIAFFAKMPKVTGLVQGMLDMMNALTRVLPLVIVKLDDEKLKQPLEKVMNILNLGIGKVLKVCAYLGIKVERKQSAAIGEIVKNRFKKDKKDFLDYEIDELNKSLDSLEKVDEEPVKPPKGQIPLDVKPNHLYPQKMPLGPHPPPPIVVPPEPPPVPVRPPPHPPKPPKPEDDQPQSSESELNPEPQIPSVIPEPPNKPPKGENGIQ